MKKTFTIAISGLLLTSQLWAQSLVSTAVSPRNAVLEEFTGVNCPNCPDGHFRANELYNAFPGRVVLINIHSGSFANPSAGQPDFRTPWGDPIDIFAGVAAYPSGTMNRVVWPGVYNAPPYFPQNPPNNLAIRRPGWWDTAYPNQGAGANIILQGGNSPVNIGAATSWNDVTRELQVTVELYYTATETQNNKLNVVFLENNVIGYQSGGSANYQHNHILRNMITGQWGETISTTTIGTLVTRNYTYTVPVGFNIDNCDISVFVTQNDNKNTHTGITIPAKNGTTTGVSTAQSSTLQMYPNPVNDELYISGIPEAASQIKIVNMLGKTVIELKPENSFMKVDLRKLSSGIYFLNYQSGNKSYVRKFIKND